MKVNFKNWVVFLLMSSCFFATNLRGQGLTQDDLIKTPSELIETNLSGDGNEAYLTQVGNKNEVSVVQNQQGVSAENLVKVLQVGNRNVGHINQTGTLNQTVLVQDGNKNEYTLNLEGSNNTFVILQKGRRNKINQNLTNTTNNYIELIQQGNDNEITHTQDGLTNQRIIVKQVGNGLKLEVIQSN